MIFKNISLGFLVKAVASFDDTLTRIPVIASLTKTRIGKVAFSIGTLLSLTAAIILAILFSEAIKSVPGVRYIIAGIIITLAIGIYFGLFMPERKKQTAKEVAKIKKISNARFLELIGLGFVISFLTILDDIIVIVPIFLERNFYEKTLVIIGIYVATLIQVSIAIYFAERVDKLRFKKELAAASLIIIAILIAFKII